MMVALTTMMLLLTVSCPRLHVVAFSSPSVLPTIFGRCLRADCRKNRSQCTRVHPAIPPSRSQDWSSSFLDDDEDNDDALLEGLRVGNHAEHEDNSLPSDETLTLSMPIPPLTPTPVSLDFNTDSALASDPIFDPVSQIAVPTRQGNAPQWTTSLAILGSVVGGTFLLTSVFSDLLSASEWFRAWRYVWPLVGFIYLTDGLSGGQYLRLFENRWQNLFNAVLGAGLVVGGAFDAFMPVWMLGPNVLTSAGLEPDAAAGLFLLSAFQTVKKEINDIGDIPFEDVRVKDLFSVLPRILLLAQLYKLGEGSFEEIVSKLLP